MGQSLPTLCCGAVIEHGDEGCRGVHTTKRPPPKLKSVGARAAGRFFDRGREPVALTDPTGEIARYARVQRDCMTRPAPPKSPTLAARIREAPFTTLLITVNVLAFCSEASKGDTTQTSVLLSAGAVERVHVLAGEWWRLGTCMFLHVGFIHLAWNSWAGFGWCGTVERSLGKTKFLAVYLASGIAGAALSTIVQEVVSAGASGALFGIIGATLVLRYRALGSWAALTRDPFARRVAMIAAVWTVLGFSMGMDSAAHGGGFAIGAALSWAFTAHDPRIRIRATALAIIAFASLTIGAVRPWWKPSTLQAEFLASYAYGYFMGIDTNGAGAKYLVDYDRARSFSQLACDGGSAIGCEYLARIYQEGLGVPKDEAHALRILERACEADHTHACFMEGLLLTDRPADAPPSQIAPNDAKAVELFDMACHAAQRDWQACVNLAERYRTGYGRPQDTPRARALLEEACVAKNDDGCAGVIFVDAGNSPGPEREANIAKLRAMCKEGAWACQLVSETAKWPAGTIHAL